MLVPTGLIAVQPDLGTAVLIVLTGATAIFLAGLGWRYIIGAAALALASLPALWFVMHDYQRKRILTLLDPDSDPLGAGYHIIQSKIAIGSGGFFGKGWLNGSQGQLEFLPERSTDFIFAVIGEEWGLMGALALMALYLFVVGRGLYIAAHRAGHLHAPAGGQPVDHVLLLCIRQFGHGDGADPGGRRAPAAGQRRRHVDGDAARRFRHPHVHPDPPEARRCGPALSRQTRLA